MKFPAEDWDLWVRATTSVAARVQSERGVQEDVALREAPAGVWWVDVGQLSLRVTGPELDVAGPGELFALVDHWVAFERSRGPGRVLPRDLAVIADWDAALDRARSIWHEACGTVFADLERSGQLPVVWCVDVQDWTDVWPEAPHTAGTSFCIRRLRISQSSDLSPWPRRRKLLLGELWLNTPDWGRGLEVPVEPRSALLQAADVIQDEVGRHLPDAWPACPAHGRHPLTPADRPEGPSWCCHADRDVTCLIGTLGT